MRFLSSLVLAIGFFASAHVVALQGVTGFVPPDRATASCEGKLAKRVAKLGRSLIKCRIRFPEAGTVRETRCRRMARDEYENALGRLSGCPSCLDPEAAGDSAERELAPTAIAAVYCDSAAGALVAAARHNAPPDDAACQNQLAKQLGAFLESVVTCHTRAADAGHLHGQRVLDDARCTAAARRAFDDGVARLGICPACDDAAHRSAIRDRVQALLDAENGALFCASPGGAFVD